MAIWPGWATMERYWLGVVNRDGHVLSHTLFAGGFYETVPNFTRSVVVSSAADGKWKRTHASDRGADRIC